MFAMQLTVPSFRPAKCNAPKVEAAGCAGSGAGGVAFPIMLSAAGLLAYSLGTLSFPGRIQC